MENENMMVNNEEIEDYENCESTNSGLGLKVIGGILATAGAIWGGLKLKKIIDAKKKEKCVEGEVVEEEIVEADIVEEEPAEKATNKKKK